MYILKEDFNEAVHGNKSPSQVCKQLLLCMLKEEAFLLSTPLVVVSSTKTPKVQLNPHVLLAIEGKMFEINLAGS